ncbi:Alginate biosynthesis sensor protein KinB [compost metagenome]
MALTPPERLDERLFDIVDQFDRASPLLTAPDERARVAELNLLAGRKAQSATAFASAISYLTAGRALLPADAWQRCYQTAFALGLRLAESQYQARRFEEAERELDALVTRAEGRTDLAAAAVVLILLHTSQGRYDRAVETGIECLARFGIALSAHPSAIPVGEAKDALWQSLAGRRIEELIDLPPLVDPEVRAVLEVLLVLHPPAVVTDANLNSLLFFHMVRLSLRHGNTDSSCYGYVWLGVVLWSVFGDYDSAYRFGKLGYDLVETRGLVGHRAKVYLCFGHMIQAWMRPMRPAIGLLRQALAVARQSGDIQYAGYTCLFVLSERIALGDPLADIHRESEEMLGFVRRAKDPLAEHIIIGQQRLLQALRGQTAALDSYDDAHFDQAAYEAYLAGEPHQPLVVGWYHIRKAMACFLAGAYDAALAASAAAEPWLWASTPFLVTADYHLYTALALAARHPEAESAAPPEALERVRACVAPFRVWAVNAPSTFGHPLAMLEAELARLEGRDLAAMRFYEQAIAGAREHGFVQHEGLAAELASRFYHARGATGVAEGLLRRARACYERWGAFGKVRQLDERHPRLREAIGEGPEGTIASTDAQIDMMAVIKASQAISGEIVLSRLAETLMRIVIESAGAQTGYLVLAKGRDLWVQAKASAEHGTDHPAPPVLASSVLPATVLAYVQRTHEAVQLDRATESPIFASDPYIVAHRPASLLCMPVLRRGHLVGMLYLENNLISCAFTPERQAVLEHLAAQAAISLENATLYEDLRHETEARLQAAEAIAHREAELAQARALDKLKSEFVHTVSHELRTPLTSIKGFIEFLEDGFGGPLTDGQRDYVQQIEKSASRLELLANDLLDYARMDAGTFRLERQEGDLAAKVREIAESFQPQASYRELTMRVLVPEAPVRLLMDSGRIDQVLNNLLSNAIKFASHGGLVEVRLREEGHQVVCEVEDSGEGIAPDDVPKLFQRFSQLESGKARGGTGLGLSISKGIIEAHGGQIGVTSRPGQGSTFWFTLPRTD